MTEDEPFDVTTDAAFEAARADLLAHLDRFIEQMYGERCPEHEDGCPICEMWALRDRIKERVG